MIQLPSGVLAPPGAAIDEAHPLASVLQHVWTGDAPANGRDRMRGAVAGVHANATRHGTPQGLALVGNGTVTGGLSSAVSVINRYPFTLIGYGYFNSAAGAWQLGDFRSTASGTVAKIAIASSTTVALDLRYNFGTQRQIAVTLPTAIGVPICMIAHMTSATDYWLVANGQVALGSLSPGTLNNLDRYYNLADTLNGGMWLQGVGQGAPVSLDYAIKVTTEPRRELAKLFRRRVWVPVGAAGGGDLTLALTGQGSTASAGSLALSLSSALGGQATATSAGTLAPSRSVALSGQGVTASAGTLTGSRSASLSGQATAASAGTLAPSATVALSGQAVAASAGTITYNASGNVTLALSGQAVAASAGTLPVTLTKAATGSAATASAGAAVPGIGISASGSAVTGSAGTLALGIAVPAAGSAATAAAGTLTYGTAGNVTVALSGSPVTSYAGTLLFELSDLVLSAPPIGHGPAMTRRTSPQGQARRAVLNTRTR